MERCASSSTSRQPSKVGAVCGNAARTVLCGGRSAMIVPTATTGHRLVRVLLKWKRLGTVLALPVVPRYEDYPLPVGPVHDLEVDILVCMPASRHSASCDDCGIAFSSKSWFAALGAWREFIQNFFNQLVGHKRIEHDAASCATLPF